MAEKTITNAKGAFRTTTTFVGGRDADGFTHDYPTTVEWYRANAAITAGQAVMWVAPTATAPVSVTPMTAAITGTDPWIHVGAARDTVAAGDMCPVVVRGFAEVFIDAAATAAAFSLLVSPGTTTGEYDIATDPADNSVEVGVVISTEVGTDKVLAYLTGTTPVRRFEAGA